ncbi:hypothetical protein R1sor_001421 [Riccia sorocarpa]|uniref:Tocopherol cyclase n=1 Tax=Riccia sorocarpa TaxID=122646 RepID=A0ABD3GYI0_9MARC
MAASALKVGCGLVERLAPAPAPTTAMQSSFNSGPEADRVPALSSKAAASANPAVKLTAPLPLPPYTPTVKDRPTRTPHSGYHFDGSSRRFFEGWYFKVSIPEIKDSFAWMYTVEEPGSLTSSSSSSSSSGDENSTGPKFHGTGAQVMGANDHYLFQYDKTVRNFWGSRHELALGHTFVPKYGKRPPNCELEGEEFLDRVEEGFQVTPTWHQGFLRDNGKSPHMKTVDSIRWAYSTKPRYGWGDAGKSQKATAGWLAAFPVFEPHWQICMAAGYSTGWIEWGDERYEFKDAPSYVEKNWGGSFPSKWFWLQSNIFEGAAGDIALTSGGGRRGLPLIPGAYEEVAMVGIHYDGKFYEFVPWRGTVEWDIAPWGSWKITAENKYYKVRLDAVSDVPGVNLRCPTVDKGLTPLCQDTFFGKLRLQLWERSVQGADKVILDVTSDQSALETGGGPWEGNWQHRSRMRFPVRTLIGLPVNVEKIFKKFPSLEPAGL